MNRCVWVCGRTHRFSALANGWVSFAEYLLAMKVDASRPKHYTHIVHLLDNSREKIDLKLAETVLAKFGLIDKWNRFLALSMWKPKNVK